MTDSTPNDELRELVDKWRGMADLACPEEFTIAYNNAADELEALLDDD